MQCSLVPIIIIGCLLVSCSSINTKRPLNPNGDSELALLMRQMYEEGMLTKQAILDKKRITLMLKHHKILTLEASDPEKVGNNIYNSFANSYLEVMAQMNDPENPNKKETYTDLVNSCMQCHRAICPGPIVRIKKMVLD